MLMHVLVSSGTARTTFAWESLDDCEDSRWYAPHRTRKSRPGPRWAMTAAIQSWSGARPISGFKTPRRNSSICFGFRTPTRF